MKAPKGTRQDTRRKLSKHPRYRGKIPISRFLQEFEIGEIVGIDIEPSYHQGMPHPKFQGKSGIIIEKQGEAYCVLLRDGNKLKKVIVHPVHLKKLNNKINEEKLKKLLIKYKHQKENKKKRIEKLLRLYKQLHVKKRKLRKIL